VQSMMRELETKMGREAVAATRYDLAAATARARNLPSSAF
jgi:hypothetical protein